MKIHYCVITKKDKYLWQKKQNATLPIRFYRYLTANFMTASLEVILTSCSRDVSVVDKTGSVHDKTEHLLASPAWYGFTNAADRGLLDSFLRQSTRLGYRDAQSPSFDSLCETADEQLFLNIMKNKQHLLRSLLPPQREQHYKLRDRVHNFQIPT